MSNSDRKTNIYLTIGTILFFGLIALYVMEFTYFSNTRHFGRLARNSMLIAVLIAAIGTFFGYKTHIFKKETIRLQVIAIVTFLIFAPFVGSFTNRKLTRARPYSENYEYLGQKGYFVEMFGKEKGQPADTYWIYLRKNEKEYVFRTNGAMPKQIAGNGRKVRLIMKKGLWGYHFFDGRSWEFI